MALVEGNLTLKTLADSGVAFGAEDYTLSLNCKWDGETEKEGFEGRHSVDLYKQDD
jgi:hypothetical protein